MNIAMYFPTFPSMGGTERVMSIIANQFVADGHDIFIYGSSPQLEKPYFELNSLIKVSVVEGVSKKEKVSSLTKALVENHIEVLINNDSFRKSVKMCGEACRQVQVKFITIHHGSVLLSESMLKTFIDGQKNMVSRLKQFFWIVYWKYKQWDYKMYHNNNLAECDAYVLLSQQYKILLGNPPKTFVINNPLSFPYSGKMSMPAKKNQLLMVGRLDNNHKRVTLALKIWGNVLDKYPDWEFVIVGDGPHRKEIEEYIQYNQISRVLLTGAQSPLSYLQDAKIFIMTSSTEGWALTLNEAKQNYCVPIVFDTFPALKDMIIEGEDGFVVTEGDIQEYTRKLGKLMTDNHMYELMAQKAYEDCSKYEISFLIKKWYDVINYVKAN